MQYFPFMALLVNFYATKFLTKEIYLLKREILKKKSGSMMDSFDIVLQILKLRAYELNFSFSVFSLQIYP